MLFVKLACRVVRSVYKHPTFVLFVMQDSNKTLTIQSLLVPIHAASKLL